MKYFYTDTETKKLLKSLTMLVDTREQKNQHIIKHFTEKGVPYKVQKLDYGDYSAFIPKNVEMGVPRDIYLTDNICIERKATLNELAQNLTHGRTQIENEFLRSKGSKLYLMVEDATWEDIKNKNYRSEYTPSAYMGTLRAFEARYDIRLNFTLSADSGSFIHSVLFYHAREFLLNGIAV
jgi:ERCC4-type nuclease